MNKKIFLIPVSIIFSMVVLALLIPARTEATNNITPNGCELECKHRNRWGICTNWEWECPISVTPTVTATPSATLTPSVTEVPVSPTETPKKGFEMGGAPEIKCENPKAVPTVIWTDNFTFMWSPSDPEVTEYVVEYRIGQNTYTTVVKSQTYTFNERIDAIRIAGLDNGCKGAWSEWSSESKASGSK